MSPWEAAREVTAGLARIMRWGRPRWDDPVPSGSTRRAIVAGLLDVVLPCPPAAPFRHPLASSQFERSVTLDLSTRFGRRVLVGTVVRLMDEPEAFVSPSLLRAILDAVASEEPGVPGLRAATARLDAEDVMSS